MAEIPAIDATVNGLTANSYGTVAEALAYMAIRPGGQLWMDLDSHERRATLLFATILIEREIFYGKKEVEAQALQFPRVPSQTENTMPLNVKHAQFEQALDLATGGYVDRMDFVETQGQGVREVRTDDTRVRMTPFHNDAVPAWKLSVTARGLIAPYIETSVIMARA